jgi:hypothetical protein
MGLDEVVTATLRNSPILAQASGTVRSDRSLERVAVGNFLPSATLNSGYLQSNQIIATAGGGYSAQNYSAGLAGVVRTARAVDPASRTLLTEVQIVNATGKLVPGMYARATLGFDRETPPLTVPASAVLFLPAGLTVAEIDSNHVVQRHVIDVGRDFGSYFEVLSGVHDGSLLLDNPSDAVPNGTRVQWQVHADTTRSQPLAVK